MYFNGLLIQTRFKKHENIPLLSYANQYDQISNEKLDRKDEKNPLKLKQPNFMRFSTLQRALVVPLKTKAGLTP